MRLAFIYGPKCLSFRGGNLTLDMDDPRGLTGSEYGILRTAEECRKAGHEATFISILGSDRQTWIDGRPGKGTIHGYWDAAVNWNEPDSLLEVDADLLVCEQMNNDFGLSTDEGVQCVDLWTSPSEGHAEHMRGLPRLARNIEWNVNRLGCDPELYPKTEKVRGRVIYCSSPDRGLHILLQQWPAIKRAVPHAHLRIFYRLEPWLRGFDQVPFFPDIEENRQRALYIEECLRRLKGHDVEVVDSVSRNRMAREMCEAEVMAYPVDTLAWSEGFSCSILEGMAARACPVITDCDALGGLYDGHTPMVKRGDWDAWTARVVRALEDPIYRSAVTKNGRTFAEEHTWKAHAERLLTLIQTRTSKT